MTTGTVFAFRKMSFQDILAGLWFSVNSVKGKSALQLSRELGVQYKTAWVLLMKMREAVATRWFRMMLEGEIHIDGKYAGGHIKQKNRKEDRVDRRRPEYQNFKRLTILTLREKTPFGRGRERTLTRVVRASIRTRPGNSSGSTSAKDRASMPTSTSRTTTWQACGTCSG